MTHVADFTVRAGERVPFVAHLVPVARRSCPRPSMRSRRSRTPSASGTSGSRGCRYDGDYREAVRTSLIMLKALTYAPTGGIVAAPTTSLPERIGGERNWDYRYCWLRDATFTLLRADERGFHATRRAPGATGCCARSPAIPRTLQILYGVGGRAPDRRVRAAVAARLRGLEAGAHRQRRARAVPARRLRRGDGRAAPGARPRASTPTTTRGRCSATLLDFLEGAWDQPDEGHLGGARRRGGTSRTRRCWRGSRSTAPCRRVERFGLHGPVDRWRRCAHEIHEEVCREGFNVELNSFTQSYGSKELDASTLLIPLARLPARPTIRASIGTVDAVQRELMRDGFVERYRTDEHNDVDGLTGRRGRRSCRARSGSSTRC